MLTSLSATCKAWYSQALIDYQRRRRRVSPILNSGLCTSKMEVQNVTDIGRLGVGVYTVHSFTILPDKEIHALSFFRVYMFVLYCQGLLLTV